jgi:hypothetical protein
MYKAATQFYEHVDKNVSSAIPETGRAYRWRWCCEPYEPAFRPFLLRKIPGTRFR